MSSGIRYQDRDLKLLSELGELGILDVETIRSRHFPLDESGKACPKKLRQYKQLGIVIQHDVPVVTDRQSRSLTVYRLTSEGASEIERLTGSRPRRAGGTKPPDSKTLIHRLGVLQTRLAIDDACRLQHLSQPEWIMEWDSDPDATTATELTERIILHHEFPNAGGVVSCWADAAFRLHLAVNPAWELLGYLEYDRSTMTHRDILDKLDGYQELFATNTYRNHWPHLAEHHIARVLFVCRSQQRIRNLIESITPHPASSFVRFAVADSLVPDDVLTSPIWHATDGEARRILKPPLDPASTIG